MVKKICPECGNKNEKDARFCAECGYDISNVVPILIDKKEKVIEPNYKKPEAIKQKKATTPKQTQKKGIAVPLLIVVIVLLVFTLFNCLVCSDIINGDKESAIEKYELAILSLVNPDRVNNTADTTEIENKSPNNNAENFNNGTDKQQTTKKQESTIWNPDNETSTSTQTTDNDNIYEVNVGDSTLNLRSEKSTKSKILHSIPNKAEIVITKIEDGWGYTTYSGKSGWVNMEFVKKK